MEYIITLTPEQNDLLVLRTAQYTASAIPPTICPPEDMPPWTPELMVQELVDADLANTAKQAAALMHDAKIVAALAALQAEEPPS